MCNNMRLHPLTEWASDGEIRVDCPTAIDLCRGVAKLVKAPDFDSGMRGFESFLPCQNPIAVALDIHSDC